MIDRARVFHISGRKNPARHAEAKLNKIDIVNVQVENRPAGLSALREMLLSPSRRLGNPPKPRTENPAVGIFINRILQPDPLRPETEAHRGHGKSLGPACCLHHLASERRTARQWLLTNHVFS